MSSQVVPPLQMGGHRANNYKNMMQCMRQNSQYGSSEHSTPQNLSLLNESYATAITMSHYAPSRSNNFSDISGVNTRKHLNSHLTTQQY